MKISRLFHWLYAILMLLPFVSVVGVGLYYAFNKNAVIPQVEKVVDLEVDFNQYVLNGLPTSNQHWYEFQEFGLSFENNSLYFEVGSDDDNVIYTDIDDRFSVNDKVLLKSTLNCIDLSYTEFAYRFYNDDESDYLQSEVFVFDDSSINLFETILTFGRYIGNVTTFGFYVYSEVGSGFYINNIQVFNLTQMFGVGNEPTIQQFNSYFPNDYYDYTSSTHLVVPNGSVEVADDLTNHFWLPSFGGFGWTIRNVFGYLIGSLFGFSIVSGSIGYVVLSLMTYWACISLIWLAYDILMYLFLLIHRYLDKGVLD